MTIAQDSLFAQRRRDAEMNKKTCLGKEKESQQVYVNYLINPAPLRLCVS